jgi:hypothetical protein
MRKGLRSLRMLNLLGCKWCVRTVIARRQYQFIAYLAIHGDDLIKEEALEELSTEYQKGRSAPCNASRSRGRVGQGTAVLR